MVRATTHTGPVVVSVALERVDYDDLVAPLLAGRSPSRAGFAAARTDSPMLPVEALVAGQAEQQRERRVWREGVVERGCCRTCAENVPEILMPLVVGFEMRAVPAR